MALALVFVGLVSGGIVALALTGNQMWLVPAVYLISFALFVVGVGAEVTWLPAWAWALLSDGILIVAGLAGGIGMLLLGTFAPPPPGWSPGVGPHVTLVIMVSLVVVAVLFEPIHWLLPTTKRRGKATSIADELHTVQQGILYLGSTLVGLEGAIVVFRLYVALPDPGAYYGP